MANYTTSLGLVKQTVGENNATWGTVLNTSIDCIEEAIAGVAVVTLSTTSKTLTIPNNTVDDARAMVLEFDGSPGGTTTVTIDNVDKVYNVYNNTGDSSSLTFTMGSGDTASVAAGERTWIYCEASAGVYRALNADGVDAADQTLSNLTNAATARTNIGLEIDALTSGKVVTITDDPATDGARPVGRCMYLLHSTNNYTAGSTTYLAGSELVADTLHAGIRIPYACTIKNLYVGTGAGVAPGAGESCAVTLNHTGGGAGDVITATISDTNTTASNTSDTHDLTAAAVLLIKVTGSSGATVAKVRVSFDIEARSLT